MIDILRDHAVERQGFVLAGEAQQALTLQHRRGLHTRQAQEIVDILLVIADASRLRFWLHAMHLHHRIGV